MASFTYHLKYHNNAIQKIKLSNKIRTIIHDLSKSKIYLTFVEMSFWTHSVNRGRISWGDHLRSG
jgi:hypothetical protein